MYVTVGLWIIVATFALMFSCSGFWQAWSKHAGEPALASGSALAFGIGMVFFAVLCALKALELMFL